MPDEQLLLDVKTMRRIVKARAALLRLRCSDLQALAAGHDPGAFNIARFISAKDELREQVYMLLDAIDAVAERKKAEIVRSGDWWTLPRWVWRWESAKVKCWIALLPPCGERFCAWQDKQFCDALAFAGLSPCASIAS